MEDYLNNLKRVNPNVEHIISEIRRNFDAGLYFGTDQGFHIASGESVGKYPNGELIAYGGFGIYDGNVVDREFILNKLFKKGYNNFPHKTLFMPKYNEISQIESENDLYELKPPTEFKGNSLYLCRCSHYNLPKRENKEYTTSLDGKHFFDLLVKTAYKEFKCNNLEILNNVGSIGAIELEIIDEKDLQLVLKFLQEYFTSRKFLALVPNKKYNELFTKFKFKFKFE